MPKPRRRYPPEFRRQLIELARAGRSPESLAKEFEPSAQTIRNWVAQAARDTGQRTDGLTSVEREEFTRLSLPASRRAARARRAAALPRRRIS